MRITLVVANELMFSGALAGDRELLDLRDGIGRAAGRLAAGLADVVPRRLHAAPAARAVGRGAGRGRARARGPRRRSPTTRPPRTRRCATSKSVRQVTADDRGVLVVALRRGDEVLALLEAVAPCGDRYRPGDARPGRRVRPRRGGRSRSARVTTE